MLLRFDFDSMMKVVFDSIMYAFEWDTSNDKIKATRASVQMNYLGR